MFGDPPPDEVTDGLHIAVEAVELGSLGILFHARVSGGDRVDEDEVGDIQDGVRIVDHAAGKGQRLGAVPGGGHEARTESAEVEPDRGRAGTTIEGEDHRAVARSLHPGAFVADVKDSGPRVAVLLFENQLRGGGLVSDLLSVHLHTGLGDDRCGGRLTRGLLLVFLRGGEPCREGAEDDHA